MFPFIGNRLVKGGAILISTSFPRFNKYDVEFAVFQHTFVVAFSLVNSQCALFVIPFHQDGCVSTFFIIIIIKFIFIKGKFRISTRIDANRQIIPLLFCRVLHCWSPRKDRSRTYINRHNINGYFPLDRLPAFQSLPGPKVCPVCSFR